MYKADYWPSDATAPALWNPLYETAETHFVTQEDGTLFALTPTGAFTLQRLRLNRPQLAANRLRKRQQAEQTRLTARLLEVIESQSQISGQEAASLEENRLHLEELRRTLLLLLRGQG